jgi:protein pelota
MQITSKNFAKGFAKLRIQTKDDLWYLGHIVEKGDDVTMRTHRRVSRDEREGEKKAITLKISVDKVEFHKYADVLRIHGTTIQDHEDVPKGSHHSFNVSIGDTLKIEKRWKNYQIEELKKAVEEAKRIAVVIVCIDDTNVEFAELRGYGVEYVGSFNFSLPRKDSPDYESKREEFYKKLFERLGKYDQRIVVAGTGFSCENIKDRLPASLKPKILLTKVNSGGRAGINEVLKSGFIERSIADSRASEEAKLVEKFMEGIAKDTATYGIKHVKKANELGAIEILLVSDSLLSEMKERGRFEELDSLMRSVEKKKGRVHIVSSEHDSGKQLESLGGIAAFLRFKIS